MTPRALFGIFQTLKEDAILLWLLKLRGKSKTRLVNGCVALTETRFFLNKSGQILIRLLNL
jgi:hypothetical protein